MKQLYTLLCLAGLASTGFSAAGDNELCDPDCCGLSYAEQISFMQRTSEGPKRAAAAPDAGALNPFAYNLSSEFSDDCRLTVSYKLNAAASSVTLKVMSGSDVVKTVALSGTDAGANSQVVDLSDLGWGDYTWSLDVTGSAITKPYYYATTPRFYHPQTVETVRNTQDPMFGTVLVAESKVSSGSGYNSTHWSYGRGGQGLYLFDPTLTGIPNTAAGSGVYAFKNWACEDSWDVTLSTTLWNKTTGSNPRKVRVADDGRVFIATCNMYTPPILSVASVSALAQNTPWTQWVGGGQKAYSTTSYTGGYWTTNDDGTGDFVAGCSVAITPVGSGSGLTLYVASGEGRMFNGNQQGARFLTYPIGNDVAWGTRVPTQIPGFYSTTSNGKYLVNTQYANIDVDPKGGVWMKQYRGAPSSTLPTLVCVNNGKLVYSDITTASQGTAIRFSPDGGRLAMATSSTVITIYDVAFAADGTPTLTALYEITHGMGSYVNDIAWDLAGNIYAVNNSGEMLKAFAIPRTVNTVNIPARDEYAFSVSEDPVGPNPDPFVTVESVGVGSANALAYDVTGTYVGNTLTASYKLNTAANNVRLVVSPVSQEGQQSVKAKAAPILRSVDLGSGSTTQGEHEITVDLSDLADGTYQWAIEVESVDHSDNPIQTFASLAFNHPQGVDVIRDPEHPYYGYLLVTEGVESANIKFHSSTAAGGSGQGIYILTPTLEGVINQTTGKYGFTGGLAASRVVNSDYTTGSSPRKLRIADDGRIFISTQTASNCPLYEVPDICDLIENDAAFTPLLAGSWDSSHQAWYNNGEYRGCPNIGLDTRGSGDDLQLVTSGGADGYYGSYTHSLSHFNIYNLGTYAEFDSTPATIPVLEGKYLETPESGNMECDNRGGIWFVQFRAAVDDDTPCIKYVAADGTVKYSDVTTNTNRGGGFRFNDDFTQLAMSTGDGVFSIFNVDFADDNTPSLTEKYRITAGMGRNFNDFAWDAANNLYAVGNNGELIKAFSIPRRTAEGVTTATVTQTAAPGYMFSVAEGVATGIDAVNSGQGDAKRNWKVTAGAGVISVIGDAKSIEIYDVNGRVISRDKRETRVGRGVYVVRVDGTAAKVVVR